MIFAHHITEQGQAGTPADDQDLCTLVIDLMLASRHDVSLHPDLAELVRQAFPLFEHLPVSAKTDAGGWCWENSKLTGTDDGGWQAGVWHDGQRAGWFGAAVIARRDKPAYVAELGSAQQAQTDADWYTGLCGTWCASCEILAWPGAAWCTECGAVTTPQQLDPCAPCSLFTFTRDYLHPTTQVCWPMGVLEGGSGVRIYVPLTDPDPEIGRIYRLGIRILRRETSRTVYGWKGIRFMEVST